MLVSPWEQEALGRAELSQNKEVHGAELAAALGGCCGPPFCRCLLRYPVNNLNKRSVYCLCFEAESRKSKLNSTKSF